MPPVVGPLEPVMTFEEIGKQLGIATNTAYQAYRSGMAKLRASAPPPESDRRCHAVPARRTRVVSSSERVEALAANWPFLFMGYRRGGKKGRY